MNCRDVVNNIINDAKLLTKMTARQTSIFRRKIYSRINDATDKEEIHKEIPYPNKKRKIIDKDQNIGSLLVMYKGLMERYTTFTNKSKVLIKKNYELDAALYEANNRLYYKTIEKMGYQLLLFSVLMLFLWMDIQTFMAYKSIYEKYKKVFIEMMGFLALFLLENYLIPLFNLLFKFLTFLDKTYFNPFINGVLDLIVNVFGC
jgi:hypothetical protein